MDVGIVGVPVIDCDPVEPGSEVALRVRHQLAGEGTKVGHLARILRRDGEPEMMPVLLAPFGESLRVGVVGSRVEHPGVRAVAGDALAFEVGDMLRERRRTKTAAAVAHDPGHDDDAPAGRAGGQGQRRPPSAAEGRAAGGPAASPERLASVARLLRGPHHLADEALRSLGALVAVMDAAGARIEVIVPRGHGSRASSPIPGMALGALKSLAFLAKAPAGPDGSDAENLQSNQPHAPGRRRRFYLAVHGRRVSVRSLHTD